MSPWWISLPSLSNGRNPEADGFVTRTLDELDGVSPHTQISDLIFHDRWNLTPEQTTNEAPQRKAVHRR